MTPQPATATDPQASKPAIAWDRVAVDWCAGIKSKQQMSIEHGVSRAGIDKHFAKLGVERGVPTGLDQAGKVDVVAARRHNFAAAYLANGGNATQAAIACGLSAKTAYSTGQRMLKHDEVATRIKEQQSQLSAKFDLRAEDVIRSLAQAIHFDPRKLYRPDGSLKPVHELDDDTAIALSGFEVTEEFSGRGEQRTSTGFTHKVKWLDKNVAREQAIKHLGLYERDNAQTQPDKTFLEAMLNARARAANR